MLKFWINLLFLSLAFSKSIEYLKIDEDIEEVFVSGEKENEYYIQENISYIFNITDEKYLYSFSSQVPDIFYVKNEDDSFELRPNETYFEKGETIYINHLKDLKETKIKISPVPIYSELNSFETIAEDKYFFIRAEEDSIIYFDSFDKNSKTYISNSTKKETYIIYFDYDINDNVHVAINPKECEENISFDPYKNNYLYLTKDKTYTLELPSDISDIMIKLSRKTSNSIISIGDNKLDSNNLYYLYENNNNAKLTLKVDKNDAIIEFLHNITMHNIIENVDYNYSNLILNKSLNILKIPKDFKKINIEIKADDNTQYSILQGYSIPPYSHYFLVEEENLLTLNHLNFTIDELYNKNIKIMDDEYYLVVISLFSAELNITIKGEHYQEEPSDENKNENENGLEWYKILLIVLGSVIFVVIIIIIVIIVIRKKKTNSSDESEEKRQILTE